MRASWLSLTLALSIGCSAQAKEIHLFNGRDLTGWEGNIVDMRSNSVQGEILEEIPPGKIEDFWSVKDGTIHCSGGQTQWSAINTVDHSFRNYRLHVEWRFLPAKPLGKDYPWSDWERNHPDWDWKVLGKTYPPSGLYNTGVDLRVQPLPMPPRGPFPHMPPHYQANIGPAESRGGTTSSETGDLVVMYGLDHAKVISVGAPDRSRDERFRFLGETAKRRFPRTAEVPERPVGEWNAFDITVNGDRIIVEVNGVKVNEIQGVLDIPGAVGLECEYAPTQYRNIRLTPIEP